MPKLYLVVGKSKDQKQYPPIKIGLDRRAQGKSYGFDRVKPKKPLSVIGL